MACFVKQFGSFLPGESCARNIGQLVRISPVKDSARFCRESEYSICFLQNSCFTHPELPALVAHARYGEFMSYEGILRLPCCSFVLGCMGTAGMTRVSVSIYYRSVFRGALLFSSHSPPQLPCLAAEARRVRFMSFHGTPRSPCGFLYLYLGCMGACLHACWADTCQRQQPGRCYPLTPSTRSLHAERRCRRFLLQAFALYIPVLSGHASTGVFRCGAGGRRSYMLPRPPRPSAIARAPLPTTKGGHGSLSAPRGARVPCGPGREIRPYGRAGPGRIPGSFLWRRRHSSVAEPAERVTPPPASPGRPRPPISPSGPDGPRPARAERA